ncbi:hypothetical protein [Halobellus sp. Atlit-38R]|uniref:DUF7504 family protein n=1 Tax=Halobellus sp. Atlit-38R TaxID=2282131 RepID=UPI0011C3BCFC|nr:hypothetical protein [Halobellus sp. Atlit-38R]
MVHRWRCPHCDFSSWAASREQAAESVKSHLLSHHHGNIGQEDFSYRWSCPYCEGENHHHERDEAVTEFKDHLFDHVEPHLKPDVHLADGIDRTGSILVKAPLESTGANGARIHLLTPANIYIFVTRDPKQRIELIRDQFSEWPASTIVITTKSQPFSEVDGIDLETIPLEIVHLNKGLGLSSLGETVSRVLSEHESTGKISLEFDILSEIIKKFEVQDVLQFLRGFTARCDRSDALSHYYVNPKAQSESVMNVFEQLFDLQVEAKGLVFESEG